MYSTARRHDFNGHVYNYNDNLRIESGVVVAEWECPSYDIHVQICEGLAKGTAYLSRLTSAGPFTFVGLVFRIEEMQEGPDRPRRLKLFLRGTAESGRLCEPSAGGNCCFKKAAVRFLEEIGWPRPKGNLAKGFLFHPIPE
jgi:hypothetical protein